MGYYQLTSTITFYYHIIPPENRWIYTPMRAGGGLVGKLEAPKATGYSNHHVPDYGMVIHPEPCD